MAEPALRPTLRARRRSSMAGATAPPFRTQPRTPRNRSGRHRDLLGRSRRLGLGPDWRERATPFWPNPALHSLARLPIRTTAPQDPAPLEPRCLLHLRLFWRLGG